MNVSVYIYDSVMSFQKRRLHDSSEQLETLESRAGRDRRTSRPAHLHRFRAKTEGKPLKNDEKIMKMMMKGWKNDGK